MSGITPCTWQLSCSSRVVSRVSAPGMGEAQEARTSRKASCSSPPARLPCFQPHCWPCRALLPSVFISRWRQGGCCLCHLKGTALAPCLQRFGQWPEARGWGAPTARFGCSFFSWLCLSPEDFPALPLAVLLSGSKTSNLPVSNHCYWEGSFTWLDLIYLDWSQIHHYSRSIYRAGLYFLTVSPCRYVYL